MNFLVTYWFEIVIGIILLGVLGYVIYKFFQEPTTQQLTKIKEWLLYAVIQAEKEFGSGTGRLKLAMVYDMFVARFPFLVKVISFELFCILVDKALIEMRKLLEDNEEIARIVFRGAPEICE